MTYTFDIYNVDIDKEKFKKWVKEYNEQPIINWTPYRATTSIQIQRPAIDKSQIVPIIDGLKHHMLVLNMVLPCVEKEKSETLSNDRLYQLKEIISEIQTSLAWCAQSIKDLEKMING